jgi:ribosome biogenesis GTPase A
MANNREKDLPQTDNQAMNIQWFPGHMTKARRRIADDIKLVDAVCEVRDARIPRSSANPDVAELTENKPRLVLLNRADQADPAATKRWAERLREEGFGVLETDCKSGRGVDKFTAAARLLLKDKLERDTERGLTKPIRLMVVGIPNVGKSSFINRVAGRRAAETSDRPGVTRGKQWITVQTVNNNGGDKKNGSVELLDTPGILWPKFDSPEVGEFLAFTGAVRDEILDLETLGRRLFQTIWAIFPERLTERYKLRADDDPETTNPLAIIARRRGFLVSGGDTDNLRAAITLLDEFRAGKLGRITLELPPEIKNA